MITPSIGPGSTITAKYPVAISEGIIKMIPLTASSPTTRNDLWFHDTTNAAVANPTALIGTTGTNHAGPVPGTIPACNIRGANPGSNNSAPPTKKGRAARTVAAANPTENTCFEFFCHGAIFDPIYYRYCSPLTGKTL